MSFDFRDYFILAHVNLAGIVGTLYVFKNPDPINFSAWCGLIATLVGTYHWFVYKDSKVPDAGG